MKKVVIFDDGKTIYEPVSELFENKDVEIIHNTRSDKWIDAVNERPDIILIDIATFGMSGLGIMHYIEAVFKDVKIFAFGMHPRVKIDLNVYEGHWFLQIDNLLDSLQTIFEGEAE